VTYFLYSSVYVHINTMGMAHVKINFWLVVTGKLAMTNLYVLLIRTGMMNVTYILASDVFLLPQEVDLSVLTSHNAVP